MLLLNVKPTIQGLSHMKNPTQTGTWYLPILQDPTFNASQQTINKRETLIASSLMAEESYVGSVAYLRDNLDWLTENSLWNQFQVFFFQFVDHVIF